VAAEINEQVHAGQAEILQSSARFRIVACGRRWGKTVTCAKDVRDGLLTHGDGWLAWWVAPTYQQAEIGLRTLLDETPDDFVRDVNRSKLRVEAVTGAIVEFKSADKPDNLRGEGVDLLVADEAAEIDQYAYENALRPTLTDSEDSRMIAISTPKGRGWFFEFYQRGRSDDWPEYEAFQGATRENPFINQADVDDAKRELPDRVFRQEYLAEFISETGGVFDQLDDRLFTSNYTLPLPPRHVVEGGATTAADLVEGIVDTVPNDVDTGVETDADGSVIDDVITAEPPCATGVDFARHQDYRVAITIDGDGRVAYFEREQGETWPQIQRAVERIYATYGGAVAVDASRDNKIVADLEAAGVPVDPVQFSPKRKRELIENLITAIENGEVSAPEIPTLRSELEVFEYDVTRGGNVRYQAPDGFHDDTVDALALAVDARTEAHRQAVATTARKGGRDEPLGTDGDAIRDAVREIEARYDDARKYGKR
jgi:hypothetical protein